MEIFIGRWTWDIGGVQSQDTEGTLYPASTLDKKYPHQETPDKTNEIIQKSHLGLIRLNPDLSFLDYLFQTTEE